MSQLRSPIATRCAGKDGFDLTVTATTGHPHVPYLRRMIRRAHKLLNPPLRELSIALVGDQRMTRLHEEFLGIATPTDVLTFELEHDEQGHVTAGEVVVCVPVARRVAARMPHGSPARELLLYALHGMLHLTGYNDTTEDGYRIMHRKEDEILRRLGVGPVFDMQSPSRNGKGVRP